MTMTTTMMNTRCTTTPTTETDVDMDMELEMALAMTPTQYRQHLHRKSFTPGPGPIPTQQDMTTTTNNNTTVASSSLGKRPYAHDEEAGFPAGVEAWPERYESLISRVPPVPGMVVDTGRVTVKTDIVVQVDRGRKRKAPVSSSSGDRRMLLDGQEMGEKDLEGQYHVQS